ncbi:MAG: hypothetical protein FJ100_10670 [Deltaproteobacteria bacterium]|nr:hypothetical protein [Deltaproteobacteria bacterium]
MCQKPKVIVLAEDNILETERSGASVIFWADMSTWKEFMGAKGVRLDLNLLEKTDNTNVLIYGEYGNDGRTFTVFARNLDGNTTSIPTGRSVAFYANKPAEFAPITRLGIQLARTDSMQGRIRISATATVLFSDVTSAWGLCSAGGLTAGTSTYTIVPNSSVWDGTLFEEGDVLFTYTGTPGGAGLKVAVFGSLDGSTYAKLVETSAITSSSSEGTRLSIPQMFPYLKLMYTLDTGTVTVTALFQGRTK